MLICPLLCLIVVDASFSLFLFPFSGMEYTQFEIFNSSIHDVLIQEEILEYFHNMISERSGLECHLFDCIFVFLSEMKVTLCMIIHACHREAHRTLRREWFSRQIGREDIRVDFNWCCVCHRSGCILE